MIIILIVLPRQLLPIYFFFIESSVVQKYTWIFEKISKKAYIPFPTENVKFQILKVLIINHFRTRPKRNAQIEYTCIYAYTYTRNESHFCVAVEWLFKKLAFCFYSSLRNRHVALNIRFERFWQTVVLTNCLKPIHGSQFFLLQTSKYQRIGFLPFWSFLTLFYLGYWQLKHIAYNIILHAEWTIFEKKQSDTTATKHPSKIFPSVHRCRAHIYCYTPQ